MPFRRIRSRHRRRHHRSGAHRHPRRKRHGRSATPPTTLGATAGTMALMSLFLLLIWVCYGQGCVGTISGADFHAVADLEDIYE